MASKHDDGAGPPPMSLHDAEFSADREARPWRWRLNLFLRTLSVFELLKGLCHWAMLIGAGGPVDPLSGASTDWFVATVFFAIADPVAGVGLWVGAAWGVAIWLIAALGQIIILGDAGPGSAGWALIALMVAAMTAYVALAFMARREAD